MLEVSSRAPQVRFTHFGLFVRDVERMADFYKQVLGFCESDRGCLGERQLIFLTRDPDEHHQIVFVSGLTQPPREEVINQISFQIPTLPELIELARELKRRDVDDLRPINHGNAWSVYFRDPEGNRIEVYLPTPWYVNQPCRVPIDLDQPAEAVRAATEAWCRQQPGFVSAEDYRERLARKIGTARAPLQSERS